MFARASGLLFSFSALLLLPSTALADWHVAESEHFVVYADTRASDLRNFSEKLERFHSAMELETGRRLPKPSPSNRVTVFMVGSSENLREIYGNPRSSVGGFYIPRAVGSVAFVPNIKIRSGGTDFSFTILMHEYAHHFLISSARHAMPRWLSEGAAEYFASAKFNSDGSVDIGLPNNDRAYEISQAVPVSLHELLDYDLYKANRSKRHDAYYGRSWLLFHYLAFDKPRDGQLEQYWNAVTSGVDSSEAAVAVFGNLDQLDDDLQDYGRKRRMPGMRWPAEAISIGPISVRDLSDGMSDMMPVMIRSKRGVDYEQAAELLLEAREIAAKHPQDANVLAALAEAEFDAGNHAQTIAVAKKAISINAGTKNAYVQQGFALFELAKDADDRDAAYQRAMQPFMALNAIEPDHTQPLIHFYRSFVRRGSVPSQDARHALERASQLAPFDHSLAFDVAMMMAYEGKTDLAAIILGPVAANPHGGNRARSAEALRTALLDAPVGVPFDVSSTIEAALATADDQGGPAD